MPLFWAFWPLPSQFVTAAPMALFCLMCPIIFAKLPQAVLADIRTITQGYFQGNKSCYGLSSFTLCLPCTSHLKTHSQALNVGKKKREGFLEEPWKGILRSSFMYDIETRCLTVAFLYDKHWAILSVHVRSRWQSRSSQFANQFLH